MNRPVRPIATIEETDADLRVQRLELRIKQLEEIVDKAAARTKSDVEIKITPITAQMAQLRNELNACVDYVVREIGPRIETSNGGREEKSASSELKKQVAAAMEAFQSFQKQIEEKMAAVTKQYGPQLEAQALIQKEFAARLAHFIKDTQLEIETREMQFRAENAQAESALKKLEERVKGLLGERDSEAQKTVERLEQKLKEVNDAMRERDARTDANQKYTEETLQQLHAQEKSQKEIAEQLKRQVAEIAEKINQRNQADEARQRQNAEMIQAQTKQIQENSDAIREQLLQLVEGKLKTYEAQVKAAEESAISGAVRLRMELDARASEFSAKHGQLFASLETMTKGQDGLEKRISAFQEQVRHLNESIRTAKESLRSDLDAQQTLAETRYREITAQVKRSVHDAVGELTPKMLSIEQKAEKLGMELDQFGLIWESKLSKAEGDLKNRIKTAGKDLEDKFQDWDKHLQKMRGMLEEGMWERIMKGALWQELETKGLSAAKASEEKISSRLSLRFWMLGVFLGVLLAGGFWGLNELLVRRVPLVIETNVEKKLSKAETQTMLRKAMTKEAPEVIKIENRKMIDALQKEVQSRVETAQDYLERGKQRYNELISQTAEKMERLEEAIARTENLQKQQKTASALAVAKPQSVPQTAEENEASGSVEGANKNWRSKAKVYVG